MAQFKATYLTSNARTVVMIHVVTSASIVDKNIGVLLEMKMLSSTSGLVKAEPC